MTRNIHFCSWLSNAASGVYIQGNNVIEEINMSWFVGIYINEFTGIFLLKTWKIERMIVKLSQTATL